MRNTTRTAAALVVSLVGLSAPSGSGLGAQIPLNLAFERPGVEGFSRPWGWDLVSMAEGADFVVDGVVFVDTTSPSHDFR